ncbi:glycosyltransferase family A protein [Photobacterium sp. DA100]|uniref:glycosyltransferase n=1 Tax=Photobacterium sp. DA100 TaxID=3027472 RepID=UPI00247B1BE4|nr:glycosyltransferase family A protein [Photobacterium sp. DA100]WEM41572.1 glycosyltransferase family A protein [Photobacterium sp. DA100]
MERLLIITPCRNEAEYAEVTLKSICNQTVRPDLWIIVDDGSTDETPNILKKYEERYDFIKVVKKNDRGRRNVGPGVVETFYYGLNSVDYKKYQFICKLDLDLDIPNKYFESCIQKFNNDPRLGTFSGKPYVKDGEKVSMEPTGDEISVGMIKLYRTVCFDDIGGFIREVMWDGIDCHLCRLKGWKAQSLDIEELRFIHLRPMGSSQKSIYTGKKRHGYGQYYMGTSLLYMLVSVIYRLKYKPYVLGSFCILFGYLESMLKGSKRFEFPGFRKHLRMFHLSSLFIGKKRTLANMNKKIEQELK